jgi:hypothetical protein
LKKLVKAFGNGAHVVLPVEMVGKEVYIMDNDDYAKKVLDDELPSPEEEEESLKRMKKLKYI